MQIIKQDLVNEYTIQLTPRPVNIRCQQPDVGFACILGSMAF
jgi:hypothetical protein